MIELKLQLPDFQTVSVPDSELARLTSWPMDRAFTGYTLDLVNQTKALFAEQGRVWKHARIVPIRSIVGHNIHLESGDCITGVKIAQKLSEVQCHSIVVISTCVQGEVLKTLAKLWQDDEGDLAFILASYCSATVEQSLRRIHESICEWSAGEELATLNPHSPGNDALDFSAQHILHKLILTDPNRPGEMPIKIIESGALDPQPSVFAVCGLTSRLDLAESTPNYRPCSQCSRIGCNYRRAAYTTLISSAGE